MGVPVDTQVIECGKGYYKSSLHKADMEFWSSSISPDTQWDDAKFLTDMYGNIASCVSNDWEMDALPSVSCYDNGNQVCNFRFRSVYRDETVALAEKMKSFADEYPGQGNFTGCRNDGKAPTTLNFVYCGVLTHMRVPASDETRNVKICFGQDTGGQHNDWYAFSPDMHIDCLSDSNKFTARFE